MGIYKYTCQHEDCKKMDEGIRKCNSCGMIIMTNRGVEPKISIEWES